MSDHDPFTLDMFGSSHSALSSGLGFGVTAFADSPAIKPDEDAPPPAAPAKRSRSRELVERQANEAAERGAKSVADTLRLAILGALSRAP